MQDDLELNTLKDIAVAAGDEILAVYNQAAVIDVTVKADNSPLTEADQRAHRLIVDRLASHTPDLPILSEESELKNWSERATWQRYWLVDPLDGTKEFINRNGEFTVNIALIEEGVARIGVVHVPVSGITYLGRPGSGAWKLSAAGELEAIKCAMIGRGSAVRVVASRSHRGELVDRLIAIIEQQLGQAEVVSMGSSLKICLLAEGEADIYPRLALTSEWDTAAAHAVLSAAGGEVYDTGFNVLRYNQKAELLNPFFIALADTGFDWQALLTPALD
ncbi:MAG: 3'(2'),5'-bisphosphate nucleotidase CysQ [Proteobacteria bacterium]|nr:3'(2'),5'-bisphosphate nucleotidase CysQ [Pseudomonadota bacterium]